MNSLKSQTATLSEVPQFEGFDVQAGQTWVYPTNYPTRDYQFNIIEKALLKNTLVSLPTGLGKTFIAAVIMYNFFRWYPQCKIIFMAPTKPLVKQQVDACYNIMAIPSDVTAELTGAKGSAIRADIWMQKRVFFITPQVLQNDLNTIDGLASKIKCIVFDEAHKAKGNHAYCEVIRRLTEQNHKYFRVLALSATPGNSVDDVLEVIRNLLISHLEFRTEESLDVQPYVYQRSLETVVVPLDEKLQQVKEEYFKILDYYTRTLKNHNIIQSNFSTLTKGKIYMTMKDFQQKTRGCGSNHYSEIMRCLNICVTLYHAYELLTRHGLRSFYSFFSAHIDKPLLRGNNQLRQLVDDVKNFIGPIPEIELLPDGTYPEIPPTVKFGHPKYFRLRDILQEHFSSSGPNSRVIVFFEYRESVMEAHMMLLQARPLIRPRIFLGQGAGITQRVQVNVVKAFREGTCNVLLSTCIGEEGLDVGNVDLIVIFDISNKSPIRMVQRMGRTGRKREGRVIVLVTEGKEQQTLKDCLIFKNNMSSYVLGSKQLKNGMYPESPRLVPYEIQPKCDKIYITVKKPVLKKNNTLKDMFRSISSSSSEPQFSQDVEIKEICERISSPQMIFNKGPPFIHDNKGVIFYKHIEKQRVLQKSKIGNSNNTKLLVNLLQFADSKRFNIPSQMQANFSQIPPQKNLKQSDIRNMFIKPTTSHNNFEAFESEVVKTKQLLDQFSKEVEEVHQHQPFPRELFLQVSNYISLNNSNQASKKCKLCPSNVHCDNFCIEVEDSNNNNWIPLDDSVFQNITVEDMKMFSEKLKSRSVTENDNLALNDFSSQLAGSHNTIQNIADTSESKLNVAEIQNHCDISDTAFNNIEFTQLIKEAEGNLCNSLAEKTFAFEAPKNLSKILNQYETEAEVFLQPQLPQPVVNAESDILKFFKLDKLENILTCTESSSQETVVYTPRIVPETSPVHNSEISPLNKTETEEIEEPGSPILSHSDRVRRVKKKLMLGKTKNQTSQNQKSPNKVYFQATKTCEIDTPSKFTMNPTKVSSTPLSKPYTNKKVNKDFLSNLVVFDICTETKDVSIQNDNKGVLENRIRTVDIDDLCDLSMFGITSTYKPKEDKEKVSPTILQALEDVSNTSDLFDAVRRKNTFTQKNSGPVEELMCNQKTNSQNSKQAILDRSKTVSGILENLDILSDTSVFDVLTQKPSELEPKLVSKKNAKVDNLAQPNSTSSQRATTVLNDFEDFCDMSVFNVLTQKLSEPPQEIVSKENAKEVDILTQTKVMSSEEKEKKVISVESQTSKASQNKEKVTTHIDDLDDFFDHSFFGVLTQKGCVPTKTLTDIETQNKIAVPKEISNSIKNNHENLSSSTLQVQSHTSLSDLFADTEPVNKSSIRQQNKGMQKSTFTKTVLDSKSISVKGHNSSISGLANQSSRDYKKPLKDLYVSRDIFDSSSDVENVCDISLLDKDLEKSNSIKHAALDEFLTKSSKNTSQNSESKTVNTKLKLACEDAENQNKNLHDSYKEIVENSFNMGNKQKINEQVSKQMVEGFVDLTQDSPEKNTLKNKAYSQMSITQMLSFVNKSQKENVDLNNVHPKISNEATFSQNKIVKNVSTSDTNYTKNTFTSSSKSEATHLGLLHDLANYEEFNKSVRIPRATKKFKLSTNKNAKVDLDLTFLAQEKTSTKADDVDPYRSLVNTSKFDVSISTETSDDEFEPMPKKSLNTTKCKHPVKVKKMLEQKSEDWFVKPSCSKKKQNPFIEVEAELSEGESVNVSEDEDETGQDCYEPNFLADETQLVDTQMHVKYLQSVKGSHLKGKFKIPDKPTHNVRNVYSQVVNNEDNTYLDDSFCVDEDEIEEVHELSELDILERKLKEMKKKKRKKTDDGSKPVKRRRIKVISSDESD